MLGSNKYKLSDTAYQKMLNYLIETMLENGKSVEDPEIIILGGQPASGKSRLGQFTANTFLSGDALSINGDDYRNLHLCFTDIVSEDEINMAVHTDPDIRPMVPKLLETAVQHKFNIVFESTLRTKQPISNTITDIRNRGYKVTVAVAARPGYSSRLGIIERYENQKEVQGHGRWTDIANHDEAYRKLPDTVRYIENSVSIDRLIVCDKDLNIIYLNERDKNGIYQIPDKRHDAAFMLEKERNITITKEIREEIEQRKDVILQKMNARSASQKEINRVKQVFRQIPENSKANTLSL